MIEKTKIPAIFKEELKKLLSSINEMDSIEKGDRICRVCSKIITLENIQLLIPRQSNTYDYICDSPVCVEEYNRKNEKKK